MHGDWQIRPPRKTHRKRHIAVGVIGAGLLALAAGLAATVGGVAPAGAATVAPVAHAVQLAPPTLAAPPPCAAGYAPITNQAGFAIAGNGVNNPVTIGATGNCFKPMDPNSCGSGCTSYCYQNGAGNALFNASGVMEVGGPCHASGHPNEQILGAGFVSGQGWVLDSVGDGNIIQPVVCGEGGSQVHTVASGFHCDHWMVN